MFLCKTREKQNLRMIALLLIGWLCPALSLPEIWPPDGRLRPNNYVPPPVCSYVQVALMLILVVILMMMTMMTFVMMMTLTIKLLMTTLVMKEEVEVSAVEETCTTKPVEECKEEEVSVLILFIIAFVFAFVFVLVFGIEY